MAKRGKLILELRIFDFGVSFLIQNSKRADQPRHSSCSHHNNSCDSHYGTHATHAIRGMHGSSSSISSSNSVSVGVEVGKIEGDRPQRGYNVNEYVRMRTHKSTPNTALKFQAKGEHVRVC